jgi:hypothetical protein
MAIGLYALAAYSHPCLCFRRDFRMCDLLLEVRGAVALLKTCIEELVEVLEEDVERLMQDAVGDTVNVFTRSSSAHPRSGSLAKYESDWLASTVAIGSRVRERLAGIRPSADD